MPAFKDLFSAHAQAYADYRPTYPDAVYEYLAGLTQAHDLAWDCATGNGQAAAGLARHYAHVLATDASEQQLQQAMQQPNVEYRLAPAEQCPLPNESADLVAVAQALHWFDLDRFFAEVERVLKPGGVLAAWCYNHIKVSTAIDPILKHYSQHTMASYWAPEVRMVNDSYQSVQMPFRPLPPPNFKVELEWTLDQLLGYLFSWSSTQKYIRENGDNPVDRLHELIAPRWGNPEATRPITFSLHFRICRK